VELCSLADSSLQRALVARRYRIVERSDVMVCRVTEAPESFRAPAGVTIRRAGPAELTELARVVATGFEAYAIGGLSVGEPIDVMYDTVATTAPLLPADRPRYLMGAGTPPDLVECVARGIDLFDCVLPTRNARNGQLFTWQGPINIKNARYAEDDRPVDEQCTCYTCRHHSRAYLRHLFLAKEIGASTLNTLHNLHFYLDTLARIRDAIVFGSFEDLRRKLHQSYSLRSLAHDVDE
jgi:tRNA-guanine transglycosylase